MDLAAFRAPETVKVALATSLLENGMGGVLPN